MLRRYLVLIIALCGIHVSIQSVFATTLIPMDLNETITEAELIFTGTVANIESRIEGQEIYTYVTFDDLQIIKGIHADKTIVVRLSGGTVGDYHSEVAGMPKFQEGGKHMIFLHGNGQYICPVVGWTQGKFNIVKDNASGAEQVLDDGNNPIEEIKDNKLVRLPRHTKQPGNSFPGTSKEHGGPPPPQKSAAGAMDSGKRLMLPEFITEIENNLGLSGAGRKP